MGRSWMWGPLSLRGPSQGAATGNGNSSLTSLSTSVVRPKCDRPRVQLLTGKALGLAGPQGFHDCEQRADDRGDSPSKSAPPFLPAQEQPVHPPCFPGDKWWLPVPRKLGFSWGDQHSERIGHSAVGSWQRHHPTEHNVACPAAQWDSPSLPWIGFPWTTTEAMAVAKPPFQMPQGLAPSCPGVQSILGQVPKLPWTWNILPLKAPLEHHEDTRSRTRQALYWGLSAGVSSPSLRM